MLKHCSPSSVDVKRRSRRQLFAIIDTDDDDHSEHSFSTSSGSSAMRSSWSRTRGLRSLSHMMLQASAADCRKPHREQSMAMKVYASCLRSDIGYKTLIVSHDTTSKEVIWMLLGKFRMKHRDPKLFYLTMDIHVKRTGVPLCRTIVLEDEARPAELKFCHPWGECKFSLQMRKGGLVRIHDSVLMAESQYKCLLVSDQTTVDEVLAILFRCYDMEQLLHKAQFCLYEQHQPDDPDCPPHRRKMHPDEQPVQVQTHWSPASRYRFVLGPTPQRISTLCPVSAAPSARVTVRKSVVTLSSRMSDVDPLEHIYVDDVVTAINNDDEVDDDDDDHSNDKLLHEDEGFFRRKALDTSYSSGQSTASSSEFSVLRFRDSPVSMSSRSNSSTDSGLPGKSLPDSRPLNCTEICDEICDESADHPTESGLNSFQRHVSLQSLLEALPAASVDSGDPDPHENVNRHHHHRDRRLHRASSLSSLSTDSKNSDLDGFFFI